MTGSRLSSLSVKVTELSGGFAVADADEVAGTVSGVPADLIPAVSTSSVIVIVIVITSVCRLRNRDHIPTICKARE